ncbi:MAG: ADP-forming succinate--CoA ligase subunit beta [Gammaproteobacteria bacterium]
MNLHEYQAKAIFARMGVPIPSGSVAHSPDEAVAIAQKLGGALWVVKAQIHAGGRGKAGGVKLCRSPAEVRAAALALIGTRLRTHQSGPDGLPVSAVLVEGGSAIAREFYLSLLVDRSRECLSFIASPDGGVEIETVAEEHPDRIVTVPLPSAASGVPGYVVRILAGRLGLPRDLFPSFEKLLAGLQESLLTTDASLIEINPLIMTESGTLIALDAKVTLDDNALFRHPDLAALDDPSQRNPAEEEAERAGLNYVALDGDIACMVNGAGLAMATMDLIQLKGGQPANFLDVGGDATAGRVTQAFHLFRSNPKVRAIFVNIFGGIVRCDLIAEGLITAMREAAPKVPVIVRLEGTRAEEGRHLLSQSGLPIEAIAGLAEAAERAVQAAGGAA